MRWALAVMALVSACSRSEIDGGEVAGGDAQALGCHPGEPMRVLASEADGAVALIQLDESDVYYLDWMSNTVNRVPRAGGAVQTYFANTSWFSRPVVLTQSALVYEIGTTIVRRPKHGGAETVLDVGAHTKLGEFTVVGDYVYVLTMDTPGLVRVPLDGGPPEELASLDAVHAMGSISATSSRLYVSPFGEAPILRTDFDATSFEPLEVFASGVWLVPGASGMFGVTSDGEISFLADDATGSIPIAQMNATTMTVFPASDGLYVTTQDTNLVASVWRVDPASGKKTEIATNLVWPAAIGEDDGCVYVADDAKILRYSKP